MKIDLYAGEVTTDTEWIRFSEITDNKQYVPGNIRFNKISIKIETKKARGIFSEKKKVTWNRSTHYLPFNRKSQHM